MTDYLNQLYPQASQDESMSKQAQMELFAKLAADHGIDLSSMDPTQISGLWDEVMSKSASDDGDEDDKGGDSDPEEKEDKGSNLPPAFLKNKKGGDDEEKEAAALEQRALAEHAEKVAGQQKFAEAQQMGEVMAQAFIDKLAEHDAAVAGSAASEEVSAETPAEPTKTAGAPEGASALDIVAAKNAVKIAAAGGYDAQKVASHLNARLVLGAPESQKIASIQDPGQAIQARSLELLESIGIPVEWEKA